MIILEIIGALLVSVVLGTGTYYLIRFVTRRLEVDAGPKEIPQEIPEPKRRKRKS